MQRLAIIFSAVVLAIAITGYAYAAPRDMVLSTPITVDMSGHQKDEMHVGELVGFLSTVTNHSPGEKRFMYM